MPTKKTLRIRNWDTWQSYRSDRSHPPWIKVHRRLMRQPKWVELTDAQRGQLVSIWLLAADQEGKIPACAKLVQKLCYMNTEPDLEFFIEQRFIEPDANVTPERRQHDVPDKTRLDQTRLDQTRLDKGARETNARFAEFWDRYPRHTNRKRAESAFRGLTKTDRAACLCGLAGYQFNPDPNYVPHAATWINQRRWEDEPLPPRSNGNGTRRPNAGERIDKILRDADAGLADEAGDGGDGPTVAPNGGHLRHG